MSIKHIPSLDGIRALAVLIVVVSHAGFGHFVPGGLGVTIFFFLSGFLITTLLIDEYKNTNTIHYPFFFVRRFLRLFPPLAACLIVVYCLVLIDVVEGGISWQGIGAQLLYLVNYHTIFEWQGDTPKGLEVLWSLAVEEHFYLIFPLTLLFLLRNFNIKMAVLAFIIVCLLVLLWRYYLFSIANVSTERIYYATDTRIDSIIFGCVLALTYNPIFSEKDKRLNRTDIGIIVFACATIIFTLLYRDDTFRQTMRYSLQGLALMPLFYYSIRNSEYVVCRCLNYKWMKKLGVYSYSIYLIHFVIIHILVTYSITTSKLGILTTTLGLSILFAHLIDKYIDAYFINLRKQYRYSAK